MECGFSVHAELISVLTGGSSRGCQENAGAAGSIYDAVPRSLTIDNYNKSTDTDTLLLDFPQPFLTNIYIQNQAKASVPLLWSRVQVYKFSLSYFLSDIVRTYLFVQIYLKTLLDNKETN